MSDALFPTLPGLTWGVARTPMWRTTISETPSGREFRFRGMKSPRYLYRLSYEFLRETGNYAELHTLMGFFNARGGSFDSFLFDDASDNAVDDQTYGIGDGRSTRWQLVRTFGGTVEPVYALNDRSGVDMEIRQNGALLKSGTHYTLDNNAVITHKAAPAAGTRLAWSGRFFWRVRFKQDQTQFAQFLRDLWEAKSVELITCKP